MVDENHHIDITIDKRSLEYILGSMDAHLGNIDGHLKELNSKTASNTKRIQILESYKNQQVGKNAIIGSIAGTIFGVVGALVTRMFGM